MSRHTYVDRDDLREGVREYILAHTGRRLALRRAPAATIACWLMVSRTTLFATLARLGLALGDLQRGRV